LGRFFVGGNAELMEKMGQTVFLRSGIEALGKAAIFGMFGECLPIVDFYAVRVN
jgi:hypothetical protein